MKAVEQYIDNMVLQLKKHNKLSSVRFVKGYNKNYTESPISAPLVAVIFKSLKNTESFLGNKVSQNLEGFEYEAEVELAIYVPFLTAGEGLDDIAMLMYEQIKLHQNLNTIKSIEIGKTTFDKSTNAVTRLLNIKLAFCLCREVIN